MANDEIESTRPNRTEEPPPFTPLREAGRPSPSDDAPKKWYQDSTKVIIFIMIALAARFGLRALAHSDTGKQDTGPHWTSSELAFIDSLDSLDSAKMTPEQRAQIMEIVRRKNEAETTKPSSGGSTSPNQGGTTSSSDNISNPAEADANQDEDSVVNSKDFTDGRPTDFLDDPDISDEHGYPTIHAVIELEGWQLLTLLQRSGFHYNQIGDGYNDWVTKGATSMVDFMHADRSISPSVVARVAKGWTDYPLHYHATMNHTFSNSNEAYESIAHCKTIATGTSEKDEFVALCENSDGKQFLALLNYYPGAGYILEVINTAGLREGSFHGEKYLNIEEAFEAATGVSV